ncbi:hypothetical protein ACR6C2_34775 [Streptomyces sp. INA 01156]
MLLHDTCPALYKMMPATAGGPATPAAAVVAQVAADDAQARPVEDTVRRLERLFPRQAGPTCQNCCCRCGASSRRARLSPCAPGMPRNGPPCCPTTGTGRSP